MHQRFALTVITTTFILCAIVIALLPKSVTESSSLSSETLDGNSWLIKDATVYDGENWLGVTNIVVKNGVITAIGKDVDDDTMTVIDASDKVIIPGLIDAHTHTYGPAREDAQRFGVTTMLDMFTAPAMLSQTRADREASGRKQGATLFSAGMLATAAGGHGTQYGIPIDVLSDPSQAEQWVADRVAEGSDFIKLVYIPESNRINSIDLETAKAVIDAAHRAGLLAVAHIDTQQAASDLLSVGVDGLVHIFADSEVTDAFITEALARNIFVIPTLSVIAVVDGQAPGKMLLEDERIASALTTAGSASLNTDFGGRIPGFELQTALSNVRRLADAGVPILAGSDAPNPGTAHGATLHQELMLLSQAGLSNETILHAATGLAATRFPIGQHGLLSVGAPADLLILTEDPRDDLTATRGIETMLRNGYVTSRAVPVINASNIVLPATLADFDNGIEAPDNFIWSETSDSMMGGQSSATLTSLAQGADASAGALAVDANVSADFAFPWAGAFFGMTTNNGAASLGSHDTIEFWTRGSAGRYRLMVFGKEQMGAPPTLEFDVTDAWTKVQLDLTALENLDRGNVTGFAFVTPMRAGQYTFAIDEIRLTRAP
ncbi:MAG: amidohydrolase family protein [Pseudomonadota bacterium]